MDSAGFGEIRPFEVSTEFEMGMYPPGTHPPFDEEIQPEQFKSQQQAKNNFATNGQEVSLLGSPNKADRQGGQQKDSKRANRNM